MISSELSNGYAVIRMVTDALRGTSIPVGAVAWNSAREWHQLRLLSGRERLDGVTPERSLLLLVLKEQLSRWTKEQRVPRFSGTLTPWSSEFWRAAGEVLSTGIRVDAPRPMEEIVGDDDFDLLFEAIVRPRRRASSRRSRIEGRLRNVLGPVLTRKTISRLEVPAYHSAQEKVLRGAVGDRGIVLFEGVNLAGRDARRDADALVSKMLRIFEGAQTRPTVRTIIGYMASPGGLNGESHMRDWIAERVTSQVYDLVREQELFRQAASRAIEEAGAQGSINL